MMYVQKLQRQKAARDLRIRIAAASVKPKAPARTRIVPNAPYGVPKERPKPESDVYHPPYEMMWFYDLVWMIDRCPRTVTIEKIQQAVCRKFGIGLGDLLSHRRTADIVLPRQMAMLVAKRLTLRSLPEIGRRFAGRDHTTVLHAVRKMEARYNGDPAFATDIDAIEREVMR